MAAFNTCRTQLGTPSVGWEHLTHRVKKGNSCFIYHGYLANLNSIKHLANLLSLVRCRRQLQQLVGQFHRLCIDPRLENQVFLGKVEPRQRQKVPLRAAVRGGQFG